MNLLKEDIEYNATLKVSMLTYPEKPVDGQIRKMSWRDAVIPVSLLSQFIHEGHTFRPFEKLKKDCKDALSNVVFIDIDHDNIGMDVRVDTLKYKPTIAYETYSNDTEDISYRFVYVFDKPFKGSQFEDLRNRIVNDNRIEKYDKLAVNQYYNGTSENKRIITTGCIYETPSDLQDIWSEIKPVEGKKQAKNSLSFSEEIWALYWKVSLTEFKTKCYEDIYCGLELPIETPYVKKGDERILERPDNYQRIPIKQRWDKDLRETVRVKWYDGEKRHQKLYNTCMAIRRICNVTADELLYYITDYFLNYIDNSDGKFDKKYLVDVVVDAMKSDVSTLMKVGKVSSFHADPDYCREHRVSKREVANKVNNEKRTEKKLERYKEIEKWYDSGKTDRENLKLLEEKGIKVSKGTLQSYKQWMKSCPEPK